MILDIGLWPVSTRTESYFSCLPNYPVIIIFFHKREKEKATRSGICYRAYTVYVLSKPLPPVTSRLIHLSQNVPILAGHVLRDFEFRCRGDEGRTLM